MPILGTLRTGDLREIVVERRRGSKFVIRRQVGESGQDQDIITLDEAGMIRLATALLVAIQPDSETK